MVNNLVIKVLSYRERKIIDLRFGLSNGYPMTLKEVGERTGLSIEYVRIIQKNALKKLRRIFKLPKYKEYFD